MIDWDGVRSPDYAPCRYGASKLTCRGPKPDLDKDYIAFLGGTEFYGKFMEHSLPQQVEAALDMPCANLGSVNAGVDLYAFDGDILQVASGARAVVFQVLGAHALSNPYYRVHPRRNDRVIAPTDLAKAVFPQVDFTNIHFARHALQNMQRVAARRFPNVVEALKSTWVSRMTDVLTRIDAPVLLFWMGDHGPSAGDAANPRDPAFVDDSMLRALAPLVAGLVQYVPHGAARQPDLDHMLCGEGDAVAARRMFSPMAQAAAARALVAPLSALLAAHPAKRLAATA